MRLIRRRTARRVSAPGTPLADEPHRRRSRHAGRAAGGRHGASAGSPEAQADMLEDKLSEWAAEIETQALPAEGAPWTHDGRDYSATFTRFSAEDSMGIDAIVVAVSTQTSGSVWSTEMRIQRLAFSSFAQFIDAGIPTCRSTTTR
jgi:hypothetical protein